MRKQTFTLTMTGIGLLTALLTVVLQAEPGKYSANDSQLNSGGGKSTSANYSAESSITIAQPEGSASLASYSVDALIEDQNTTGLEWVQYELGE